ncbi:hypothetical protein FE391_06780 [Nonomuraea sp. KC401]|uniref:hypothetical protein n=1 Tax=unclassified Nonomuraea TaxID=2593643 RepID=UPI0010FF130C|nr:MULTISPECIES: hypothetical protein [unclassified Nonomuraea]NBE93485.1 hypothetical protein [Nonomuraea sp. K271]TLF81414.1 hypothetical protein FE391_06780 [Nonomuraea sp. KC401]
MRLSLLAGVVAGTFAALPGPGHAAAGTSSASVQVTGGRLQPRYTGSADANNVLVTLESQTNALRVSDSVTITPGAGCVHAPGDTTTVRCSAGIAAGVPAGTPAAIPAWAGQARRWQRVRPVAVGRSSGAVSSQIGPIRR